MNRHTLSLLLGIAVWALGLDTPEAPERGCPDQRACIAMAAYTEARGEGLVGMVAVAEVVLARGGEPCDVITEPGQFEGVERVRRPFEPWKTDPKGWGAALIAARIAQEGGHVTCPGATHFYAHPITTPTWAEQGRPACVIGGHTFLAME